MSDNLTIEEQYTEICRNSENIKGLYNYLRDYQKECIEKKRSLPNSLIKMWCGTGKTRIFTTSIFEFACLLNVIVFPSLGLINQYNTDYVADTNFEEYWSEYEILSFCSATETGKFKKTSKKIKYTTSEQTLKTFLKKKGKKLITVTYQSFQKFVEIIKKTQNRIDYLIYDEAHHTVGSQIQNVVYKDDGFKRLVDKTEYYTATPINRKGIIMYDKDDPEKNECGPMIFEYNKAQAEAEGYSRKYDVVLDLSEQTNTVNKYHHIFASIIRTCLSGESDYWNVLTFHAGVNESETRQNSVVKEFASKKNQSYVRKLFKKIQNEEFPKTKDIITEISLVGVHSKTRKREQILADFDRKVPGRIMILSSCQTIGEGIDTKWANMEVPVDPTKSIINTMQKIGRITRKPEPDMPNSILLLPVSVDPEKYKLADTKEKRDELIREELDEQGDFNTLLNVISAFKYQMDPELYDLCLKYPNMYSPDEVKNNLKKQGFETLENQGTLSDNVNYLLDDKQELDECIVENVTQSLENIASKIDKPIIVHTQNYDELKTYNEESAEAPVHLFCDENGDYFPVKPKDKKYMKKRVNLPNKREKLFTIKTNPEFRMLWGITDESLRNALETGMGRGILDCGISWNDKKHNDWYINYELVKEFMLLENNIPLNDTIYKNQNIGNWCQIQRVKKRQKQLKQIYINQLNDLELWCWDIRWMKNYIKAKLELNQYDYLAFRCDMNNWCRKQRYDYIDKKLNKYKIRKLEEITFWAWNSNDENWISRWWYYAKKIKEHENSNIKLNENLTIWCEQQKYSHANTLSKPDTYCKTYYAYPGDMFTLTKMQIDFLESIYISGINWSNEFILHQNWYIRLQNMKKYIGKFNRIPRIDTDKSLYNWFKKQKSEYKKILKEKSVTTTWKYKRTKEKWEEFINDPKYKAILEGKSRPAKPSVKSVNIKPKAEKEGGAAKSSGKKQSKKEWQKIGKKMSMQTSKNTNKMFKESPEMWEQYHASRDESFKTYTEQDEIPVNKITTYLDKKTKHKMKILDLGCGRNYIKEAFKENKKFTITGYDHVSCNGSVACDISKLPEEDDSVHMCIFSQSLMGHNWKDYLQEAERVLMYNGEIIISESIERYEKIKEVVLEMGLHIKIDDYSETKRWFYIHAIKD